MGMSSQETFPLSVDLQPPGGAPLPGVGSSWHSAAGLTAEIEPANGGNEKLWQVGQWYCI